MADEITTALSALRDRRKQKYREYAAYYDGDHKLAFATDKFLNAFGKLFKAFSDNLCPAVVDAVADRLDLVGFGVETGEAKAGQEAQAIWLANRMDKRAGEAHLEALRSGDAYVIVWPDAEGRPVLYPNKAEAVTVAYDDDTPGLIRWAVKVWKMTDGLGRVTVYYPDRIEKFVTKQKLYGTNLPESASNLDPYEIDGEPWPLPNTYGVVPVFHLANNTDVGAFGRSELLNILPVQDALNKAVTDMLVAMEYVALPQRWATGLEVDIDPDTGRPKAPFVPGVDRVWAVASEDVRFGQFDPANLEQFTRVQEGFRAEIARISGTPLHYLLLQTGDFPSGEAMKTAESRFLSKVRDRQVSFGNAWEDAMRLALRIAGRADVRLHAQWRDPAPRSEKEHAETLLLKQQIGVPDRQLQREAGYSDEDIARMQTERQEERATTAELGSRLLANFEAGRDDEEGR